MFENIEVLRNTHESYHIFIPDKGDIMEILYHPESIKELINRLPNNNYESFTVFIRTKINVYFMIKKDNSAINVYKLKCDPDVQYEEQNLLYSIEGDIINYKIDDYKSYIDKKLYKRFTLFSDQAEICKSILYPKKRVN